MTDASTNMVDYEETRRTFRLDVPARFNFARDVVDRQVLARQDDLSLLELDPQGRASGAENETNLKPIPAGTESAAPFPLQTRSVMMR